jgi:hypothetical protein
LLDRRKQDDEAVVVAAVLDDNCCIGRDIDSESEEILLGRTTNPCTEHDNDNISSSRDKTVDSIALVVGLKLETLEARVTRSTVNSQTAEIAAPKRPPN